MPNALQRARYEKRFASIEASFRMEGMDPSQDEIYRMAKARVLAGTMTPKQALAYVVEQSVKQREKVAATA